jgi:hypothetical protein
MTDDQIIDQIVHSFIRFNLRDIQEIYNNEKEFTIAEFILCSCLIDQVSGFRYNMDKVGKRYRQFVKEYLPRYNSDELYNDLRNKLVHNYSIGSRYRLTSKAMHLHLQEVDGNIYLNLSDFIADIRSALDQYFSQLKNDKVIRQNAISWFQQHKIIGQSS